MKVKDGDFVSAIESMTRSSGNPSAPAGPAWPAQASPSASPAATAEVTAQELAAHGLQPEPATGASLRFAPPVQSVAIRRTFERPWWRRLLRSLGVLAVVVVLMLVYVGTLARDSDGPDGVFTTLFALAWVLPLVMWFKSRHLGEQTLTAQGYPVGVLASVPVFGGAAQIDVMTADDDEFDADELLPLAGVPLPPAGTAVSAATDLAFELSDLLVKPWHKAMATAGAPDTSHAQAAVERFCKGLADALGVAPASVLAAYPELSDDFPEGEGGALTFVWIVVRGGQVRGIDAVCQAIGAAAEQVQATYQVQADD